jgi:hypothetical protein
MTGKPAGWKSLKRISKENFIGPFHYSFLIQTENCYFNNAQPGNTTVQVYGPTPVAVILHLVKKPLMLPAGD